MNKKYLYILVIVALVFGVFLISQKPEPTKEVSAPIVSDYKNAIYTIDGNKIELKNGYAESSIPESSSKTVTRYFGNELETDLNGDGINDVVFLVTQETGGSGTFYYAVGAVKTDSGYTGSNGYFLGDRIAPQTTEKSQNPKHKNVVVINYADRMDSEPMTTQPSVGKSVYLKLGQDNKWGVVAADFEGESR